MCFVCLRKHIGFKSISFKIKYWEMDKYCAKLKRRIEKSSTFILCLKIFELTGQQLCLRQIFMIQNKIHHSIKKLTCDIKAGKGGRGGQY